MKKLLLLLAIPLIGASCAASQSTNQSANVNGDIQNNANTQSQVQGRAVFSVTDAAANLQNVSSVRLVVNKLEVHNSTQGWLNLSIDSKEFDLWKLKNSSKLELLTDAKLATGTYDQVRLHVKQVTVVRAGVEQTAKLPSNTLTLIGNIVVNSDETTSVVVDFQLDKSFHETGNGKLILSPVIQLQSKSRANVEIKSDNSVESNGGTVTTSVSLGMNENGEMKQNFRLGDDLKLEITNNDALHVSSDNDAKAKVTADQAVATAKENGNVDIALSVKMESRNGINVWHIFGTRNLLTVNVYVDANTGIVVAGQ